MLPSPNHRMNTGTQASEGIGISALASGRKKFSTGRKRPIRMPSGSPTATASAKPDQHAVERARRVRRAWCRRAAWSTSASPTFGSVGISAGGNAPLRATAS